MACVCLRNSLPEVSKIRCHNVQHGNWTASDAQLRLELQQLPCVANLFEAPLHSDSNRAHVSVERCLGGLEVLVAQVVLEGR
jgi:hypothetical protein